MDIDTYAAVTVDTRTILDILDIIGAFVMLWANQKITGNAGFRTPEARWALLRRMVYLLTAMALFVLGIERQYVASSAETAGQTMLLVYVLLFPVLRAIDLTTQDRLRH